MQNVATLILPDQKKTLMEQAGDLSGVEIFNNQVLVAVYIRPEKTAGGIILADQTRKEDEFQGKIGLVLKVGPTAFDPNAEEWFKDVTINVGDWVLFKPSDGWGMKVGGPNGPMCRVLDDVAIRGRVDRPDRLY